MLKSVNLILILALLDLNFDRVRSNDEINENTYSVYEYMQVLQSIPNFFEYLLNVVEKKSEILGNNKVPMITKTIEEDIKIEAYDNGFVNPRDDENCVWNEKVYEVNTNIDNTGSKNIEVDKYESTLKLKDISTAAYEYKSLLMFGTKEDTCKMKSIKTIDQNKNVVLSKDRKVTQKKQKSNNIKNEASYLGSYEDADDDWGQAYASPGFRNIFSLDVTVEDIEKRILMTEKLLEEYNVNRLALNKKSE